MAEARMGGWLALAQCETPRPGAPCPRPPHPHAPLQRTGLMERGALVFELAAPLRGAAVLLDYRAEAAGWERAFSILHDARNGLTIRHRQGQAVAWHRLLGPLPSGAGVARITLAFDAPARHWRLCYRHTGSGVQLDAAGTAPLPLPLDDLDRMTAPDPAARRHEALLWFGASAQAAPPQPANWVDHRTPIATPGGLRLAGSLTAGEPVLTASGAARPLRAVRHYDLPARGSHTPVRLRAPYFAPHRDTLVSPDLPVRLTGRRIEDLFGDEAVLVAAQHVTDGTAALFDPGQTLLRAVSLDIGAPDLVQADGMAFLSAAPATTPPPLRQLRGFEAVPLLAMPGRSGAGWCAA